MGNSRVFARTMDELAAISIHAVAFGVKLLALLCFVFGWEAVPAADLNVSMGKIALNHKQYTLIP